MINLSKLLRSSLFLLIVFYLGFNQSVLSQNFKVRHIIEIKNMKFVPSELTIHKGDTVIWINRDIFPHDITEIKNKTWSSATLLQGKSWYKVITKNEDYYCSLHVVMKGTIIVN